MASGFLYVMGSRDWISLLRYGCRVFPNLGSNKRAENKTRLLDPQDVAFEVSRVRVPHWPRGVVFFRCVDPTFFFEATITKRRMQRCSMLNWLMPS